MTPAPCAGFVWFRWVRPTRQHRMVPHMVVFHPTRQPVVVPTETLLYNNSQALSNWAYPWPVHSLSWRRTLPYCSGCGKPGRL